MPFLALDSRGRLVIPRELREQIDLRPGGTVYIEVHDGRLWLEPYDDPYVLMSSQQFLEMAEEEERSSPIEQSQELQEEMTIWDQAAGDGLDEIAREETMQGLPVSDLWASRPTEEAVHAPKAR